MKILPLLAVVALSFSLAAAEQIAKPKELNKLEKVGEFVYTLRVDKINTEVMNTFAPYNEKAWQHKEYINKELDKRLGLGCSGVRNGDFHGRNLDFYMSDTPMIVVWTEKSENRFASVGVAMDPELSLGLLKSHAIAKKDEKVFSSAKNIELMPLSITDGVNENGVVVQVNVVPNEDVNNTTGPNKDALELGYSMVPRFVLDHAKSAKHAVELLKERNLVQKPKMFEMHFMISDPKESFIVEIVNDKINVVEGQKAHIMTNYFASLEPTPHGIGYERYDILKKYYAEGSDLKGMTKLMSRVAYSQAYNPDTKPFWYSEHYGLDKASGKDYNLNTPKDDAGFRAVLDRNWAQAKAATIVNNPDMIWHTSFTSIYNIKEKSLRLFTHENYNKSWDFKLDK